jgi:hypothetical protein
MEIAILAQLFMMKVLVYTSLQWKSGFQFTPEIYGLHEHSENPEGGLLRLSFEEGNSGGQDHYSVLIRVRPSRDEFRLSSSEDEAPSEIPKATVFPYPRAAASDSHSDYDSDYESDFRQYFEAPPLTMLQLSQLPCYFKWFNAVALLQKLNWPHDIWRQETDTAAGRGIFVGVWVEKGDTVARYWGHLVDNCGIVQMECPVTTLLFKNCSDARRPFSLAHGVTVDRRRSNLIVDGSHHIGSTYDRCEGRFVCIEVVFVFYRSHIKQERPSLGQLYQQLRAYRYAAKLRGGILRQPPLSSHQRIIKTNWKHEQQAGFHYRDITHSSGNRAQASVLCDASPSECCASSNSDQSWQAQRG